MDAGEEQYGVRKYFYFIKEKVSSDWKDLAWQLGFRWADISNIAGKNQDDKSCCLDLLEEWLKRNGERATIEVLMEALSEANLQNIVDELKIKYPETAAQRPSVGENEAQAENMKVPEGLKALETTNDSVKLGWTEVSSTQADGYRLEQSIAFERKWVSAQGGRKLLPATITDFTVVDLIPYMEYHFCVRSAIDRMGELVLSERSVPLYVVTRKPCQPYQPRTIKLTDHTHAPLSLTWKEPSPAADVNPACYEYIVEMCAHCKDKSLNIWAEYCRTTQCHCPINVQDNGVYRFRVSANNTERDVNSLPKEMGDPDLPIHIKTKSEWLIEVLKTFWPFSATTQPRSQESGSITFNISCHDLEGLRELWMNYKLGKVKKFFENFFARLARLSSVQTDTELEIKIDKEDFYSCRRHLLLTRPTSKGFRLVRLGEGDSRGTRLGLSEDYPVYCKPISHKTTCSQLDFLDPAIPVDQLALDRTIAADKLSVFGREKSRLEVQLHSARAQLETERQEAKALKEEVNKMKKEEDKTQKIILERNIEIQQLQETNNNILTARRQTKNIVLNLSKEVTRLTEEKEKAQKMLQEQKIEIQQLQENTTSMAATIEELMNAKHTAKSESGGQEHGREGDQEKETYSGETKAMRKGVTKPTEDEEKAQEIILEQKIEIQQLQETNKNMEDRIEGMQTARKQTEALVLNLTREVTRERKEKEKAYKILLEQKIEIQQLHENTKGMAATIVELMDAKHTAKGESGGQEHGREGDQEKETYSRETDPEKKEESGKKSQFGPKDRPVVSAVAMKGDQTDLDVDPPSTSQPKKTVPLHEEYVKAKKQDTTDSNGASPSGSGEMDQEPQTSHSAVSTMASAQADSPLVQFKLSRHNKLYAKISENLTEDQVRDLRAILITDCHITKSKIETATPHEMFNMLEGAGKLGDGNLGLLKELLIALKKGMLAKEAEELEWDEWLYSKLGFKVEALKPKAGWRTVLGSSIPLILPNDLKYDASTGRVEKVHGAWRESLHVVPEALALLEGIEEPVSVLAICGPCRTGKSYILSRLLGTADAFELGHRMDPQTFGIWMGTKVLRGKDFTIVLLDTEGIDLLAASAGQDASILVLTILLSSHLIYNSLNVPHKRDLENMESFIKLAKGITVKKGEKTQVSAFCEHFPDFLWLLRDVYLKMIDQDGEEMDPSEYLKTRILGRDPDEDDFEESTSDKVGRAILSFFPSVECAILERPSEKVEVMNNVAQYTESLNPEFNKGVQDLIERLLLKSRAKRGYDKVSTVNGLALSIMAKQYVEAVNDPNSIPALDNTWKNTVEVMRNKAIEEAVTEYNELMKLKALVANAMMMQIGDVPLEENKATEKEIHPSLMDLHNASLKEVTDMLLRKVGHFGISSESWGTHESNTVVDQLQKRLVQREERTVDYVAEDGTFQKEKGLVVTGGELYKYIQQNKEQSKIFCQKLFKRLFDPFRKNVESPPPGYDFKKMTGELGHVYQQYEEQARGPEKWVVLVEMTKNVKKLEADLEKIKGYQKKVFEEQQKAQEKELKAKEQVRVLQQLNKQNQDMQKAQQQQHMEQMEKGFPKQKEVFDPVLVHFFEEREMTLASSEDPLVEEAAKQTGKTIDEVLNFITIYNMSKTEHKERPLADDSDRAEGKKNSSTQTGHHHIITQTDLEQLLDTILSRLDETDRKLLMRVWSARTGEQLESPGAGASADLIRDMMKNEYIRTGYLRMLEKDMMAAGISFPAIIQDIPGVPEELKYTRTLEAAVGPTGRELEIPGFVKLVVPPDALEQDTVITISTVDVAAILRDPESANWLSGYPWSLGEDACPRELLDQVLFSPAVDINLHGAQLSGPVEVQTWRPPGSKGMGCLLLKHHDGEGWTDFTASMVHQIYLDKISTSLQTFSPLTILWAPVDTLITVGKMVVAALSSRTLNCQFAGYIKPHTDGVEFHVVCRDRSVKTDDYQPDFTLCGRNKAMFDLYHGNRVDVTVSILQGQERSRQMKLRAQQCCEDEGQSVQMLLDRPNGKPVKGDVTISNIQVRPPETVCEFSFWEFQEGGILTSDGNTHKMETHPKRLQPQAVPSDIRTDPSATAVARCIPIVVELKPPWRELGRNLGLSDADTERISQRHRDDTERCCLAVLEEWLHLSGTNATVEGLKTALDLAGQKEMVEKLNTMEQSMRGQLLELQSEVTDIVHPNFPNLNFVPDKNKEVDERRIELNRRTLREEVFSNSFNFSLDSVILDRIQERKKSVCRINWPGGSGTGFLLSKGKVLTCYHVYRLMSRALWSVHEASQYTATFFVSTGMEHKVPFESPAALLKCYSEDLDYAILQLAVEDEMERHLESLPLLVHFISESEDSRKMVVLVGHPSGGNKIVDFGCIAGVVRRYIVHVRFPNMIQEDEQKPLYDTSVMFHGSSGSPGFDTYGNVVLMHTRGFPDASSKSLIERGVRLSAIRDHARQNLAPDVFNEIFPATSEQVAVPLASVSIS